MADKTKFPGEVEFEGAIDTSGGLTVTNTEDASSKSVAALVCSGGVGVEKKLHVGTGIEMDAGTLAALNLKHQYTISGSTGIVNLSGSATHTAVANHMYALTRAAGCTLTLPTPTKIGEKIKVVITPNSSNNNIIATAETDQLFEGYAFVQPAAGAAGPSGSAVPAIFHPDVTNDDAITLNGTTTGGAGEVVLTCTSITAGAERWLVEAELFGSGTLTTPFS